VTNNIAFLHHGRNYSALQKFMNDVDLKRTKMLTLSVLLVNTSMHLVKSSITKSSIGMKCRRR